MAIYLKKFSTHQEYEVFTATTAFIKPNVSICTTEGDIHYNPYVEPVETRVVAKYNVTSTISPTMIASGTSNFTAIEIDGVAQSTVESAYTFSTTGEHTVKYTLADPTSIGESAFRGCSGLTSCTIGSCVTSISNGAFSRCDGLTRLNSDVDGVFNIPSGVTSIGDEAFANCYSLTSIDIPDSVTSISNDAFYGCSGLISIEIPSGVTTIGNGAFDSCSSLTSIVIPSGVTSIGDYAFFVCTSLTSINMPSSVTYIGDYAFGCCPIEDEDTRNAIEAINPDAFYCD